MSLGAGPHPLLLPILYSNNKYGLGYHGFCGRERLSLYLSEGHGYDPASFTPLSRRICSAICRSPGVVNLILEYRPNVSWKCMEIMYLIIYVCMYVCMWYLHGETESLDHTNIVCHFQLLIADLNKVIFNG